MRKLFITCFFLFLLGNLFAQGSAHFQKSDHLVYDYSSILTPEQNAALEQRLLAFNDTTSNQIVIIITPTLYGEEIMDLGTSIAHSWGIGQKDLDNGVLILIKSKTDEEPDGDVALLPGYGLEGVLPDAFCKEIIDDSMIVHLAEGDYYNALVSALNIIEPVCHGEYSYEQYQDKKDAEDTTFSILSLLFWGFIIFYIVRRIKKNGGFSSGSGSGYSGHSSGWSSSSHSSSHSSSSFGGFGGGGFSGGGAHSKF